MGPVGAAARGGGVLEWLGGVGAWATTGFCAMVGPEKVGGGKLIDWGLVDWQPIAKSAVKIVSVREEATR